MWSRAALFAFLVVEFQQQRQHPRQHDPLLVRVHGECAQGVRVFIVLSTVMESAQSLPPLAPPDGALRTEAK